MQKRRSLYRITLERVFGFFIFFIMLYAANLLTTTIENQLFHDIVLFLNSNLLRIIIYSILFFIGELFMNIIFPISLIGPIFNAFGSLYLLGFIFNCLKFAQEQTGHEVFKVMRGFIIPVYFMVFIAVLLVGYLWIFHTLTRAEEEEEKPKKTNKMKAKKEKQPTWDDVGQEFRQLLYDMFSNLRESVKPRKK